MNNKFSVAALCICIVILLEGMQVVAFSQTRHIPLKAPTEANMPFKPGERLIFNLHYEVGIINADVAKGYFTIEQTKLDDVPVYKVRLRGKSSSFFDMFFKVREDYSSYIRISDMKPVRFDRYTREGKYLTEDKYIFNWTDNPYIDAEMNTKGKELRQFTLPLDEYTYDIITLFCKMRMADMDKVKKGDKFDLFFVLGRRSEEAVLKYVGEEELKLPDYGKVNAIKVSLMLKEDNNEEKQKGATDLWFSNDENRIPLKFESPLKIGKVSGTLIGHGGLKYPFVVKF